MWHLCVMSQLWQLSKKNNTQSCTALSWAFRFRSLTHIVGAWNCDLVQRKMQTAGYCHFGKTSNNLTRIDRLRQLQHLTRCDSLVCKSSKCVAVMMQWDDTGSAIVCSSRLVAQRNRMLIKDDRIETALTRISFERIQFSLFHAKNNAHECVECKNNMK